jgi:hypothetical protein
VRPSARSVLLIGASFALGCLEPSSPSTSPTPVTVGLRVSMNLGGTPVTAVVVRVTASDLPDTLVFNLAVTNRQASETIPVPAGSARVIVVHAYDADGTETDRGSATIDVQPGNNPTLAIVLTPLGGNLPIVVIFGTVNGPGATEREFAQRGRYSTAVRDRDGQSR